MKEKREANKAARQEVKERQKAEKEAAAGEGGEAKAAEKKEKKEKTKKKPPLKKKDSTHTPVADKSAVEPHVSEPDDGFFQREVTGKGASGDVLHAGRLRLSKLGADGAV